MWYHFYSPCALISDPNPNQCPESYHNPNPIPNPNPTEKWNFFSRFGERWSRDHLKAVFAYNFSGLHFYPTSCGVIRNQRRKIRQNWFSSNENTEILKILGEWISACVPTYNVIIILKTKLSITRVLRFLIYKIFVKIVIDINWKIPTVDVFSKKLNTRKLDQILKKKHTTMRL